MAHGGGQPAQATKQLIVGLLGDDPLLGALCRAGQGSSWPLGKTGQMRRHQHLRHSSVQGKAGGGGGGGGGVQVHDLLMVYPAGECKHALVFISRLGLSALGVPRRG